MFLLKNISNENKYLPILWGLGFMIKEKQALEAAYAPHIKREQSAKRV